MKKALQIILSLAAIAVFAKGLVSMFTTEKAYVETSRHIYHCSQYCDKIDGITEADKDYMDETGNTAGTIEKSSRECYNDISLKMCSYCFSPMEIKYRDEHLAPLRKEAKENTK